MSRKIDARGSIRKNIIRIFWKSTRKNANRWKPPMCRWLENVSTIGSQPSKTQTAMGEHAWIQKVLSEGVRPTLTFFLVFRFLVNKRREDPNTT